MATIMSHAEAFTYFFMRNVTIKYSAVALLRHLANSSKLVYLDLSWQDVLRDINFLGKTVCSNLEYLLLDNCNNLNAYSVIQVVKLSSKLKMLSLNGLALSPDKVQVITHLVLSRLFSIGLTGAVLSVETAEILFQNHPSLLFLQLSNWVHNTMLVFFLKFNTLHIVYAIIVIGYLGHVLSVNQRQLHVHLGMYNRISVGYLLKMGRLDCYTAKCNN